MQPICSYFLLILFIFLSACSTKGSQKRVVLKGDYITRHHNEIAYAPPPPQKKVQISYPWEKPMTGNFTKLTKEFFRCKGSNLNPARVVQNENRIERIFDCGGSEKHSLPIMENEEFIYPILINLVNYIQAKTEKKVVITSGHRCPEHNMYADPDNIYSKHMIGAEVSFYVQGLEEQPEKLIKIIQDYYLEVDKYKGQKEYEEFKRYEKNDTNVSIQPWMNKEIFVKLFKKGEGRNFDNRHPYPYISIQVRYDYDKQEKVAYSWDRAYHGYLRK